jgi:hypothetical protein
VVVVGALVVDVVVVVELVLVDVLVDVLVEVLVLVLVEVLVDVLVDVLLVEVLVEVLVDVLLVVVVVGIKLTGMLIKFVYTPVDTTLIIVVPLGTREVVYPAVKSDAATFVSNAGEYPFASERRLKGPESPPTGITNVINAVIIYLLYFYY